MSRFMTLVFLCISYYGASGQNLSAVAFDGVDDRIQIGNTAFFNIEEQITLEAWVRVDDDQFSDFGRIIDKFNFEEEEGYNLIINDGYLFMEIFNPDGDNFGVFGNTQLTDNEWHHVAGVFDGSELRIYIDGQLDEDEETGPQTIGSSDNDLAFGNNWDGGSFLPLHGNIDEVRIWSIARTQEEINTFQNQCLTGNEAGLVGYWQMDEASGTTLFDLTGNGNHGMLQSGASWVTQVPEIQCCQSFTLGISSVFVACNGQCTGEIEILDVSGGTAPYQYLWNDGSTSGLLTDLCAGVYSVTVTDATGCSATETIEIIQPSPLIANVTFTDETAPGANDGTASASPFGGIAPYTFLWSNGSTAPDIAGLAPGTYSVTVTDANGCSAVENVQIAAFPCALSVSAEITEILCSGSCDGIIDITVFNATEPLSYLWNDGTTVDDLVDVCAGEHFVTVTDADGCVVTASYTLTEPTPLNLVIDEIIHVSDSTTGSVSISVNGGIEPYFYAWTGPDGFTHAGQDVNNLEPGVYMITIADANGCVVTTSIEILDESVGFNDLRIEILRVYPNPASTEVSLDVNTADNFTVQLTNISGELVQKWENSRSIDISTIPQGVYMIRAIWTEREAIGRIVISR